MGSAGSLQAKSDSAFDADKETITPQSRPSSKTKLRGSKRTKINNLDCDKEKDQRLPQEDDLTDKYFQRAQKAEKQCIVLEKQMGALEVSNLDLQDQIQSLEERLEYAHREQEQPTCEVEDDCTETVKAKNLVIERLEVEIQDVKQEMKKLRVQCKKKLKSLKLKSNESKQGDTMKMFELKSEISQLQEENERLKSQLSDASFRDDKKPAPSNSSNAGSSDEDPRTNLILDLSAQVSQQDARIIELENRLHEKNKEMEELQRQQSKSKSKVADIDSTAEINELQKIAQEMKALKLANKSKGKRKKKEVIVKHEDETDFRGSSGQSRDSGIHEFSARVDRNSSPVHSIENSYGSKKFSLSSALKNSESSPISDSFDSHRTENSSLNGTNRSVVETCRTVLSDDDDRWTSDHENDMEVDENKNLNIRQISAPKRRPKSKEINELTVKMWEEKKQAGKPPVYRRTGLDAKGECEDMKEVDTLINSIDADMFGDSSYRNVAEVST